MIENQNIDKILIENQNIDQILIENQNIDQILIENQEPHPSGQILGKCKNVEKTRVSSIWARAGAQ